MFNFKNRFQTFKPINSFGKASISFYLFIYIVEFWSWIKMKNLNERYS